MIVGALILFAISLAGVHLACRVFAYEITHLRKLAAAACFAALNSIPVPIPFFSLLVPPIALYMCLMDDSYDRTTVNKVFGLTFVFSIIGVLVVYGARS